MNMDNFIGVFDTMEECIEAAKIAQKKLVNEYSLADRDRFLNSIKKLYADNAEEMAQLEFDETGNLNLTVESKEDDFFFDEIGSVLKIKQLRAEKRELLENMETYFRVFFLQEGQDVTGN